MAAERTPEFLSSPISELRKLPAETTWVEFKEDNSNAEVIGQLLSALSNAAALDRKANAYVVWGIRDGSHEVVGTIFQPERQRRGNESIENWLLQALSPRLPFHFHEAQYSGERLVLLEIPRASSRPVQFEGVEYISIGSQRRRLKDYPEIERELWRIFDDTPFEDAVAIDRVAGVKVLSLLDTSSYFRLLQQPLPVTEEKVLECLASDGLVTANQAGGWDIRNLGAILFAQDLAAFKGLSRKAIRVVVYEGMGRLRPVREQVLRKGYAVGFAELIGFLDAILPRDELIELAFRREVAAFPNIAVRELVANMLIHQDFAVTGAGPLIEIFSDRMEITNPGVPLVSTDRFVDTPPRSRNEAVASLMRRIGICEERGSGIDKVVSSTEHYQLPAPIFETVEGSTRTVLFAHKPIRDMDRQERVRACYLHACLRYVERDQMTNSSLRSRFGVEERNSAIISRFIREAIEDRMIKPYDPDQGKKYARYVPIWS